jgi:hypothetical protein
VSVQCAQIVCLGAFISFGIFSIGKERKKSKKMSLILR